MGTITIGVDLAKQVFSMCEVDATGQILKRLTLKRDAFPSGSRNGPPAPWWRWKPAAAHTIGRGAVWNTAWCRA